MKKIKYLVLILIIHVKNNLSLKLFNKVSIIKFLKKMINKNYNRSQIILVKKAFLIYNNKINHKLNFYQIKDGEFKEIF